MKSRESAQAKRAMEDGEGEGEETESTRWLAVPRDLA